MPVHVASSANPPHLLLSLSSFPLLPEVPSLCSFRHHLWRSSATPPPPSVLSLSLSLSLSEAHIDKTRVDHQLPAVDAPHTQAKET